MELLPFVLVVTSAISHAAWNLLAKGGSDKESFMWLMTATSLFTMLPVFYFILPEWRFPLEALPYFLISGVAETLYFITLRKAYEFGDLSVVYPLARSSPLFITVLAVLFLGEEISPWGAIGVLLMVLGVYTLHLKGLQTKDILYPLRSLRGRASQLALMTALWTTAYSMSDKVGVSTVDPILYAFWMDAFIVLFITPVILWRRGWRGIREDWEETKVRAVVAGFLARFGYILVLVAMSLIQVSYILALRQISVVLGTAAGVLLLKERYGRMRLIGSAIMFIGVYILAALV
jgi:drug/metabolite transporter (DMT)-like permease